MRVFQDGQVFDQGFVDSIQLQRMTTNNNPHLILLNIGIGDGSVRVRAIVAIAQDAFNVIQAQEYADLNATIQAITQALQEQDYENPVANTLVFFKKQLYQAALRLRQAELAEIDASINAPAPPAAVEPVAANADADDALVIVNPEDVPVGLVPDRIHAIEPDAVIAIHHPAPVVVAQPAEVAGQPPVPVEGELDQGVLAAEGEGGLDQDAPVPVDAVEGGLEAVNAHAVVAVLAQAIPALATGDLFERIKQIHAANTAFNANPALTQNGANQLPTQELQAAYKQHLDAAKVADKDHISATRMQYKK